VAGTRGSGDCGGSGTAMFCLGDMCREYQCRIGGYEAQCSDGHEENKEQRRMRMMGTIESMHGCWKARRKRVLSVCSGFP
jgi:hypothetical protein